MHTGLTSPIGERLRRVRKYVEDEEMFLANYADVLTDMPLDDMLDRFRGQPDKVGALLAVPPQSAFHCLDVGDDDTIHSISTLQQMAIWENGGYFVLRPEIFDYIPENGDLVADGAMVLAKEGRMMAYPYGGSGSPPTRSRSAPRWRPPTRAAAGRGCSGTPSARRSALPCRPRSRPCVTPSTSADAQPPSRAS